MILSIVEDSHTFVQDSLFLRKILVTLVLIVDNDVLFYLMLSLMLSFLCRFILSLN